MKNYLLVNRALAAEKNIYLNLNQIKSNPDGQTTVNRQSRLMSHQGWFRNLAMIFAVLVMSVANVGMAWGYWYLPGTIHYNAWGNGDNQMNGDNTIVFYAVPAGTYYFKLSNGTSQSGHDILSSVSGSAISSHGTEGAQTTITLSKAADLTFHVTNESTWMVSVVASAPSYMIKYQWNNGDWAWSMPMTDNGDGTYSCVGKYGGTSYNKIKKSQNHTTGDSGTATKEGSISNGNMCVFTYTASTGALFIRKTNSITKTDHFYFDNTNAGWSETHTYFVIGRPINDASPYSTMYGDMTQIPNTNLWYSSNGSDNWTDAAYFAIAGGSSAWDSKHDWGPTALSGWAKYSAPCYTALDMVNGGCYVITKEDGSNGGAIAVAKYGSSTGYSTLNNLKLVFKYTLSTNGGSTYSDMSSGKTPSKITMDWYKFKALNEVTAGTQKKINAEASSYSNYAENVGYRTKTKLEVSDLQDGYEFVGWYDGDTEKSTATTYTYYPAANCTITARFKSILVTSITLNKTSTTLTAGGDTETLTTTVLPANALDKTVTWSTSNSSIATVSNGVVTPRAEGTCTITATAHDGSGKSATCTVTVEAGVPTHTLTWNLDGGTATGGTAAGSVAEGAALTPPTVTKVGYDFAGWTPEVPSTMPSSNATYTAQWTKVYASGTYQFDGHLTVGTSPSYTVSTTTSDYAAKRADNIFFSATNIQFEGTDGTPAGDGEDFNGWKVKASTTIKFFVEDDSDVEVSIGSIGGGTCTITYTDQSSVVHNNTSISAGSQPSYEVKAGTMVTISMAPSSGKSITLKRIAISGSASCTTNPTVTAGGNSAVTTTTATVSCAGGISSLGTGGCTITEYGFVIGTATGPTIGGSGVTPHVVGTSYASTGTPFSKDLTDLTASTTYYVRPYATNGYGTAYGTQTSFTTEAAAGACPTGGDIFTLNMTYSGSSAVKVAANGTLAMTATHGTATGGSVTFGNQNASSTDKMQIKKTGIAYINGNDAYIKLDLTCPLKTGDVLTFTSDEAKEISFTTTDTRATSVKTSSKKWTVTSAFNNVSTIYIWRASNNSVNLHTINIVRPITVTFDKNGGSSVSPTTATYDGTSSSVLATPVRADYHLVGWNTRADGSGTDLGLPGETYHLDVTTNTATVYAKWVEKSCASGTIYKFQVATSLTNDAFPRQEEVYIKTSDYLANLTGGYLKGYNSSSSDYLSITDKQYICIGNSGSYLLVQLDCPLQSGDKIKSTVTAQTMYVTKASDSRTNTVTLPTTANNEQTIPAALVGATELKIWAGSSNGGKISLFEIIREASTYTVTYNGNDQTSAAGTVPTDATNYAYNATVTTAAQGSLAKTNYTFGGWNTKNDGTGTNTAAGSTFTITDNTTLYAKWTQTVTFDANTENHGSTGGSATAVWNATGLTGITHATPASGYKLTGYYTAETGGTKVLNSDGSFASSNVTDYITDGKWICVASTRTLYAQYEAAGSLIWNLGVNTDATSLTTSSKTSAFTQIAVANMSNATTAGGVTYEKGKKTNLTGLISTPASYDADKYVYVNFQVASGYKFTPSSVKVKAQPASTAKSVKLVLSDANSNSQEFTTASTLSAGSIHDVIMTGNGTAYTGIVTLKIYCYGATDSYRLGTPIQIDGDVEELCATMPSFTQMNYTTTTFAPSANASGSPITIVGGENINSYQWKYNTTNDRTSGTNCGTGPSLVPLTDVASGTTRYYWCEMKNEACDIRIKSPAVAITVVAAKSDATVEWTAPAEVNYGGGGYTVKATVDQSAWNGNAADLVITAPAGIRIYNIVSGTTVDSKKYVQASFDVTTAFDRETYSTTIPFTVSADATATYNAISDEHAVDFDACTGGGGSSEEYMPVDAAHIDNTTWKGGWVYSGIGMMRYNHGGSAVDDDNVKSLDHNMGAGDVITEYYKSSANHFGFYTEKAINGVRLYVYTSNDKSTVSGVYIANSAYASGNPSTGAVTYEATYYNDDDGLLGATNDGCTWVEILFDSEVAAGKYGQINLSKNVNIAGIAFISSSGSGAKLDTHLQWSGSLKNGATVDKKTTDAYFTYSASMITENMNSLGAITYSSSDPSVATVDATGKVAMVAAGTTTIKATLAASGCYKKAEISYTLNVTVPECTIAAGTLTLTSGSESKCSSANVTLTLTGFESGATTTIQWKDGDTDITNGGNYTIKTAGTTSTLTTNQPGTYSVIVTKDDCFVRSNRITIKNASAEASVSKIIDEWYIKQGRLTPDIALFNAEGATSFTIKDASTNAEVTSIAGCTFELQDDVIYLHGYSIAGVGPTGIESAANETIKVVVTDACGNEASVGNIIIHKQIRTDKHVLAFVVNGTEKGDWTAGVTADQTTNVGLYNAIAAQFDVQATNIYATDDEKKLKEYYSQYDILCITDYPNTKTKGVNSKSYVDAIGALIDIRPILTMEAYVSGLANWRAKGISGNPKSPTTRQYTMDLQCKDHEIFAGTNLTKVGEGDEVMYRVSMVDKTKEDYATLDATYGATLPHKEKESKSGAGDGEYNYGGKPALQGFTFTEEMANDLLPIGLIDDGAGNPLQVGIERQRNMEARLMVLGINSYAMERLTNDGDRVVINALNYLMKKNAEDIADCSTSFVGGAEGDEENWMNADNWTGNTVPDKTQKVRILAPCVIPSGVKPHVASVVIAPHDGGMINHGADEANGSLTIKAGGALIVDGKVEAATAPNYYTTRATTPTDLVIGSDESNGNGTLIFDNLNGETQATVEYYTKSNTNEGDVWNWQYMAVPFGDNSSAYRNYYDSYLYRWAADCSGWEVVPNRGEVYPWVGYCITQVGEKTYYMDGTLVETGEQVFTVPGGKDLVLGNSWSAPIQVKQFADDDFVNLRKNVYLFNTGYDPEGGSSETGTRYAASTYVTIPIHSATYTGDSMVSSLQAFIVYTDGASDGTLTLDYDRHVRPARSTDIVNAGRMHAPRRGASISEEPTVLKIYASGSRYDDRLVVLERGDFSTGLDDGWDGDKRISGNVSPNLYAETDNGKESVSAIPDMEGTLLGFRAGEDNAYTLHFNYSEDEALYLLDMENNIYTPVNNESSYTFVTSDKSEHTRFILTRMAPGIATGVTDLDAEAPKAQKIIYNDKLYIIRGGKVFSADGQIVR